MSGATSEAKLAEDCDVWSSPPMAIQHSFTNWKNQSGLGVMVDKLPDECPICHFAIHATTYGTGGIVGSIGQSAFSCPRLECRSYFVGYYDVDTQKMTGSLTRTAPVTFKDREFSKYIADVSKAFVKIFNQAAHGESMGLDEICGVGYRKSLEFLVKDYSKHVQPSDKHEGIEKAPLASCIENYINEANIKSVAKRAVWLGNDETHYVRIWTGLDIKHLKTLLDLTIKWIESDLQTREVVAEMPPPAKP